MRIGIPREIKSQEGRVALLPEQIKRLVRKGHEVFVETKAGFLAEATDEQYHKAGAKILNNLGDIYQNSELIVKVKEILEPEFPLLKKEHIIFTNIHSALDAVQTEVLLEKKLTAISAEETHEFGSPNCTLAGEVGAFEGIALTLANRGGCGRHFMRHFGAKPTRVVVIGLGAVGQGALRTTLNLGCSVRGFNLSFFPCKQANLTWHKYDFKALGMDKLHDYLFDCDVIINCVKWDKHRKDHIINRRDLKKLKRSCVIVDISCDKAGAVETCIPTTWENPTYYEEGICHFCVDNIPGAVPVASSRGYAEAIFSKVESIALNGAIKACRQDEWLAKGLTCHNGNLILEETAKVQNKEFIPVQEYLAA
ncbi:MAG: alanine dehydrogenase [Alphaproteobacteria bacterium]